MCSEEITIKTKMKNGTTRQYSTITRKAAPTDSNLSVILEGNAYKIAPAPIANLENLKDGYTSFKNTLQKKTVNESISVDGDINYNGVNLIGNKIKLNSNTSLTINGSLIKSSKITLAACWMNSSNVVLRAGKLKILSNSEYSLIKKITFTFKNNQFCALYGNIDFALNRTSPLYAIGAHKAKITFSPYSCIEPTSVEPTYKYVEPTENNGNS